MKLLIAISALLVLMTGVLCGPHMGNPQFRRECFLPAGEEITNRIISIYQRKDYFYAMRIETDENDYIELLGPGWETLGDSPLRRGDRLLSVDGCTMRDVVSFSGPEERSRDLAPLLTEGYISKMNFVLAAPHSAWSGRIQYIIVDRAGRILTISTEDWRAQ